MRDGVDGFLVSPGDVEALCERLDWCASHRDRVIEMGRAAAAASRELSWEVHATRVEEFARRWLESRI